MGLPRVYLVRKNLAARQRIGKDKLAMSKLLLALMLAAWLVFCRSSVAQQASAPLPVYDTVVIRLDDSLSGRISSNIDDTSYRAVNVTLKHLLVNAYGIREGLLSGLPGWAGSMRFDVTAKVTDPDIHALRSLSPEQRQAMLAAVLVSRFHLQTHIELKTLPGVRTGDRKRRPQADGQRGSAGCEPRPRRRCSKFDIHNGDIMKLRR